MPEVDGPKLIAILWDNAVRTVEGPDSQGAPINPEDVWAQLHTSLAALGLELDVRPRADGKPSTDVDPAWVAEMNRLASGLGDEG